MATTASSTQTLAEKIDARYADKSRIINEKAVSAGLWGAAAAVFALFGAPAILPVFGVILAASSIHDLVSAEGARRALGAAKQQAASGATDEIHNSKAKVRLPAFMSSVALAVSVGVMLFTSPVTAPLLFMCATAVFVPSSLANSYLRGREAALGAIAPDLPPSPPAPETMEAPGRILNLRSPANDFAAKAAPAAAAPQPAVTPAPKPQAPRQG